MLGLCAGGIVLSTVVAHLAAIGEQDRIAGLTLGVCVLDNRHAGTAGAFMEPSTAAVAVADSARRGYLDGRSLAGVFAWLRPNDLIWNYWVSNYLLGKDPPAFDILYWNADTTNMPAGLHRDFVRHGARELARRARGATVLGTPIDLSQITVDAYVVAGIADHITPWTSDYRTVHLLGSAPRFVLSTSGHIAAMVNPPGNPKASYRVNDQLPEDAEDWLASAKQTPGTWWEDWTEWLAERSGGERAAPARRSAARATGRSRARPGATCSSRCPTPPSTARACTTSATAAAQPLLLITGFTISAAVFEPVLDLYTRRFECILYDNRASGRSDAPLRPTSMPELAADAAGLLRALGVDSAHVYGALDGRHDRPGAGDPLPRARARASCSAAPRRAGRARCCPPSRELAALGGTVARHRGLAGALFSPEFRREHPDRVRELLPLLRAPPRRRRTARWAHLWRHRLPRHALAAGRHPGADAGAARRRATRWRRSPTPGCSPSGSPTPSWPSSAGAGHAYALERPEESYERARGVAGPARADRGRPAAHGA